MKNVKNIHRRNFYYFPSVKRDSVPRLQINRQINRKYFHDIESREESFITLVKMFSDSFLAH